MPVTKVIHQPFKNGGFNLKEKAVTETVRDLDEGISYFKANKIVESHNARLNSLINLGDMAWHVAFYEHLNGFGDHFTLGVLQQTNPIVVTNPLLSSCDWDSDLRRRNGPGPGGNWSDTITSVKSISVPKYWLLCEHVGFGGDRFLGYGDCPDLRAVGFNDKASSIIMSSISPEVVAFAAKLAPA